MWNTISEVSPGFIMKRPQVRFTPSHYTIPHVQRCLASPIPVLCWYWIGQGKDDSIFVVLWSMAEAGVGHQKVFVE